jgi:hypothetical protein
MNRPDKTQKDSHSLQDKQQKRRWSCLLTALALLIALLILLLIIGLFLIRPTPEPYIQNYIPHNSNGLIRISIEQDNTHLMQLLEYFNEHLVLDHNNPQNNDIAVKGILAFLKFFFHTKAYVMLAPAEEIQTLDFAAIVFFRRYPTVSNMFLKGFVDALEQSSQQVAAFYDFQVLFNPSMQLYISPTKRETLLASNPQFIKNILYKKYHGDLITSTTSSLFNQYLDNMPPSGLVHGFLVNQNDNFENLYALLDELSLQTSIDFVSLDQLELKTANIEAITLNARLLSSDRIEVLLNFICPSQQTRNAISHTFLTEIQQHIEEYLGELQQYSIQTENIEQTFQIRFELAGIKNFVAQIAQDATK